MSVQRKIKLWSRKMKECINETIMEKYEFRNIRPEETDQVVKIEQICFPPNEAWKVTKK